MTIIKRGSREDAEQVTQGRHPGVQSALQWLTFSHLPEALQIFSEPFYSAAVELIERISTDSAELTTALNKLIEAKDSAVRAGIRHETGRAGSVPRPQTVVNPPKFDRTPSSATFGQAQVPMRSDQQLPGETTEARAWGKEGPILGAAGFYERDQDDMFTRPEGADQ